MPTVAFPAEHAAPEVAAVYRAAAQERLRALMTLAGGLAHNVRSPLTAIMGRAELISFRQPELGEQMGNVVSECERVNGMLRWLTEALTLRAAMAPQPVVLNDLVARECEFMRFDRHFKHEVHKEFALAEALRPVSAVYGALAEAFAAIVDNAVTGMRESAERRLVIATEVKGDAVRLSVCDSGRGIRPDTLLRVFEPGFTTREGDRYGDRPVEGTGRGYGLTFAGAAVEECGGTVEVSSEPGAGTTATIILPAC